VIAAKLVSKGVRDVQLEPEHGGRKRLAIIVEAERAGDSASERALGDEVQDAEMVDRNSRDQTS
jgi:hypothetical protein